MTLATEIARRMLAKRAATKPTAPVVAKAAPKPTSAPVREAIAAHKPAQAAESLINRFADQRAKSAESRSAPCSTPDQRPHPSPLPRSAPSYVPPRSEPDIAEIYRQLPEVFGPAEPERLPPNLATGFRGSCKAINADTGRQCALLAGHTTSHRHGQTAFVRVAAPNQKSFTRRELLDAAAIASQPAEIHQTKSIAQEQRESRRRRAHAGDTTSTGLKSIDAANTTNSTEAA